MAEKFAENHLQAITQRHPFSYKDVGKWLDEIQYDVEDATAILNLRSEIDVIRAALQEILEKCRVNPEATKPWEKHLADISEAVKAAGISPEDADALKDTLKKIESALAISKTSLTESSPRGPVPMADDTRIELVRKLAESISKIAKNKFDIDQNKFISLEELKVFVGQIVSQTKRIVRDPKLFQEWAESMAKIPNPRTTGGVSKSEDFK